MDGNKVVNAQNLAELAKKIKEGGGSEQHLYWHSVRISRSASNYELGFTVYLIILSSSSTAFDKSSLFTLINSDMTAEFIFVNGVMQAYSSVVDYIPRRLMGRDSQYNTVTFYYFKPQEGAENYFTLSTDDSDRSTVKDAVNQIF